MTALSGFSRCGQSLHTLGGVAMNKGDYAQADLASAQAAYLRGDSKTARDLASRAKTRFAIGTPGWVKADDIVSAKPLPGQKSN